MSHEIRTPISVILGYSEILLKEDLRFADRMKAATTVRRNGENLMALVNDILDLSRVESGHLKIHCARFNLRDFIADLIQQMAVNADDKGLALSWSVTGFMPETVETDSSRLRQILFNLIGNAVKFTAAGRVHLSVALIESGIAKSHLQLVVADTGIGIDAAAQAWLFCPFSQADTSVARKYGGTGLGLNLSRQLAFALGGTCYLARSAPNQGSEFVATIDPGDLTGVQMLSDSVRQMAGASDTAAPISNASLSIDLSEYHILLAEDFLDNQDLFRTIIEDNSGAVDLAGNGQEALDMAMSRDYSVILMDLQMPIMDGYTATVELRKHGYKRPIIALTAHAMRSELERCLDLGFNAYLTKPFSRAQLLTTIATAVQVN